MAWLFGQVWVLCVVSFLLGAGLTWLLVSRRDPVTAPPPVAQAAVPPPAEPAPPRPEVPPPPPARPVDPALSALDSRDDPPVTGVGRAATGALDGLGVREAGSRRGPDLVIPAQGGSTGGPPPTGRTAVDPGSG